MRNRSYICIQLIESVVACILEICWQNINESGMRKQKKKTRRESCVQMRMGIYSIFDRILTTSFLLSFFLLSFVRSFSLSVRLFTSGSWCLYINRRRNAWRCERHKIDCKTSEIEKVKEKCKINVLTHASFLVGRQVFKA